MTEKKLNPCPFCDSDDVGFDDEHRCVTCQSCGAFGPGTGTEDTAVSDWNDSKPASAPDAQHGGVAILIVNGYHVEVVAPYLQGVASGAMLEAITQVILEHTNTTERGQQRQPVGGEG